MMPQPNANEIFVARQPIFDAQQRVSAYELLYRSSRENSFDGTHADQATPTVIINSFLNIGLDHLVGDHPAFINFDRRFLVNGYAEMLPNDRITVEVLETVEPDAEVVFACRRLKDKGYRLALDDFVCDTGYEELIPLADIIKVDFRLASPSQQKVLIDRYLSRGIRFLAEKVESNQEFQQARDAGYSLFQGYFFCRPSIIVGKEIPGFKLNYLRVLKEISAPALDYLSLEQAMKHEVSLVHKMLRYVNSAHFARRPTIESIRHALVLLGEQEIRKWIGLVAMTGLAGDKPQEIVTQSVVRGRFCEQIAPAMGLANRQSEMFLLGMFSLLDAVLDRPMEEILQEVPVAPELRDVILGSPDAPAGLSDMLRLVQAYEKGDWKHTEEIISRTGAPTIAPNIYYLEAINFANDLFNE